MKDYYNILGVSETAEDEVITAAYRALMRKYHPDTNRNPNSSDKAKEINEAYEVLRDAAKRQAYDQRRRSNAGSQSAEQDRARQERERARSERERGEQQDRERKQREAQARAKQEQENREREKRRQEQQEREANERKRRESAESSEKRGPSGSAESNYDVAKNINNDWTATKILLSGFAGIVVIITWAVSNENTSRRDYVANDYPKDIDGNSDFGVYEFNRELESRKAKVLPDRESETHVTRNYESIRNELSADDYYYDKNFDKLKELSDKGDSDAQFLLGLSFENGFIGVKDIKKAISFYELASRQRNISAERNLGLIYIDDGPFKDYSKAFPLFLHAAQNGDVTSKTIVGFLYSQGYGINQDNRKAVYWSLQAANSGDSAAMFNLGLHHEYGRGTDINLSEAYRWYQLSASRGSELAKKQIGWIVQIMNEDQISEGKRLVSEFNSTIGRSLKSTDQKKDNDHG